MYTTGFWHKEHWRDNDCHIVVTWNEFAGTESLIQVFLNGTLRINRLFTAVNTVEREKERVNKSEEKIG